MFGKRNIPKIFTLIICISVIINLIVGVLNMMPPTAYGIWSFEGCY